MKQPIPIFIETDTIHLDQLLKWIGMTDTGGQARFMIEDGKIQVNGNNVKEKRKKIHLGDCITINEQEYTVSQEKK